MAVPTKSVATRHTQHATYPVRAAGLLDAADERGGTRSSLSDGVGSSGQQIWPSAARFCGYYWCGPGLGSGPSSRSGAFGWVPETGRRILNRKLDSGIIASGVIGISR